MTHIKKIRESVSQEMIDRILDKINEVGFENLTQKEKDMLTFRNQFDDFDIRRDKPIHREKFTKRVKIFEDDEIKVTISKFADDEGNIKYFGTFKMFPNEFILKQLVFVINAKAKKSSLEDIYGLSLKDQEFTEYIKDNVPEEQLKKLNIQKFIAICIKSFTQLMQGTSLGEEGSMEEPQNPLNN